MERIAAGVPAGANKPFQSTASTAKPFSSKVGHDAGRAPERCLPVSAMTFTLSPSISVLPDDGDTTPSGTSPAAMPLAEAGPPRYGTCRSLMLAATAIH